MQINKIGDIMNSYGNIETTDKMLFTREFTDDNYSISMDDIGEMMIYHDRANANLPHTPESTNLALAALLKKEYAMNRIFTKDVVNSHKNCEIHLHNLDMPDRLYCGGHSPAYVAKYGLSLPSQNAIAKPAKHPEVFLEQLVKFSAGLQGHFSGAVGFDAVNMFIAPYLVGLDEKKMKQLAQILVFEFSQQAVARGGQVTFSDLNLYWEIPKHYANVAAIGAGGVETGLRYIDYENESKAFMRALMNVYKEGDGSGRPFFFPKPDCHITASSVEDEEYMNLLGDVASVKGSPYFVFDRGTDPSISQCCFDGKTKVLVRDDFGIYNINIEDVRCVNNTKVFHNGSWVPFKRVVTRRNGKKMFKIKTSHGKELIATEDHLFPTLKGDLRADNLSIDDYVLFNTRTLNIEPHYSEGMTYEQGVMIGAFLGDGSFNGSGAINFSLDETSYNQLKPLIEKGYRDFTGKTKEMSMRVDGKLYACYIGANNIASYIEKWINGRYAIDKSPNLACLRESTEFRIGIVDGWEMTDGGNSNRIYSVSKDMIDNFEIILTSLGIQCRVDVSDRTDEPVIIRGEIFKRNYPLYCLRLYDTKVQRQKDEIYKIRNNSIWFKIESIEKIEEYNEDIVYCFEMTNTDEPYFTMPNGWIVHNCRLKISMSQDDVSELNEPWKVRFNAMQNVTMNLPGLMLKAGGDERLFNEYLMYNMDLAAKAHQQKFDFVDKLLAMGSHGPLTLLTMNMDGNPYVRYDKTKFLCGMVGLNEAVHILTGQELHESRDSMITGMRIIASMNAKCKEITNTIGFTTILEQTPAESTAYRFAKNDLKTYGDKSKLYIKGLIGSNEIYYTNSTQMNISATMSAIERVKLEGKIHPLIDAGAITHVWLGEHTPSAESISAFAKKTFYNTSNSQIAFSPEFTTCCACNRTVKGLNETCVYCGSKHVEQATRVTGYFSKINSWNKGKRGELKDRHRVVI